MKCKDPTDRLLADLQRRVRAYEGQLGPYRQLVGVDTTPAQSIVPPLSITGTPVGSNIQFTIVWESAPGSQYQAQSSTDSTTWTNEDSPIPASASPATSTSWTSSPISIDDTPIFWRIRRFPTAFSPCPE